MYPDGSGKADFGLTAGRAAPVGRRGSRPGGGQGAEQPAAERRRDGYVEGEQLSPQTGAEIKWSKIWEKTEAGRLALYLPVSPGFSGDRRRLCRQQ